MDVMYVQTYLRSTFEVFTSSCCKSVFPVDSRAVNQIATAIIAIIFA